MQNGELMQAYDYFLRSAIHIVTFDKITQDRKLQLIVKKYSEMDVQEGKMLVSRLNNLHNNILHSKPSQFPYFIEVLRILTKAKIYNASSYLKSFEPTFNIKNFINELLSRKINSHTLEKNDQIVVDFMKNIMNLDYGDFADLFEGIEVYGSSKNGFRLMSSDYDYSIKFSEFLDERDFLSAFYDHVESFLESNYDSDEYEIEAKLDESIRVPVVDLKLKRGNISLSFSVNNKLAIYNSKLLFAYSQFDQRCRKLGLLVKIWAKKHNVLGSYKGYLCSYALILLVICFLQNLNDPILPSLQEESRKEKTIQITRTVQNLREQKFLAKVDFERNPWRLKKLKKKFSSNDANVGELFIGFLEFFSQPKKFAEIQFSVKAGDFFKRSKDDKIALYSIEDPFDTGYNAGYSLKKGSPEANRFMAKMRNTVQLLKQNKWKEVFY